MYKNLFFSIGHQFFVTLKHFLQDLDFNFVDWSMACRPHCCDIDCSKSTNQKEDFKPKRDFVFVRQVSSIEPCQCCWIYIHNLQNVLSFQHIYFNLSLSVHRLMPECIKIFVNLHFFPPNHDNFRILLRLPFCQFLF